MLKKYNFSPNTTKLTNPSFPKIKNVTLIMYETLIYTWIHIHEHILLYWSVYSWALF